MRLGSLIEGVVNPWKPVAAVLAILCVILAVGGGVQTLRLSWAHEDLAAEKQARSDEHAVAEKAAREAVERIREVEARHAADQQRLTDEYQKDLQRQADAAAAARADADSLRDAVACYASGDCLGATTPAPSGVDWKRRASALGRALTRVDQFAGRCAQDADRLSDLARAMKRQIEADRSACSSPLE